MRVARMILDYLWPEPPLRVVPSLHTVETDPDIRIAIVRVEGSVSRRGRQYEQGKALSGQFTRTDAMVIDLHTVEAKLAPRQFDTFLMAVRSGTNYARCHFVLNEPWLAAIRGQPTLGWRAYQDLDTALTAAATDERRRKQNQRTHAALDLTRVILRGGLGPLRFGMTPAEVRALMGEPDRDESESWEYEDHDLTLEFKNLTDRGTCLVQLSTDSPRARLYEMALIGPSLAQTRSRLEQAGVKHRFTYTGDGEDVQFFSHGLTLHTFKDSVDLVEWSIETEKDDEPIDWSGSAQVG